MSNEELDATWLVYTRCLTSTFFFFEKFYEISPNQTQLYLMVSGPFVSEFLTLSHGFHQSSVKPKYVKSLRPQYPFPYLVTNLLYVTKSTFPVL